MAVFFYDTVRNTGIFFWGGGEFIFKGITNLPEYTGNVPATLFSFIAFDSKVLKQNMRLCGCFGRYLKGLNLAQF